MKLPTEIEFDISLKNVINQIKNEIMIFESMNITEYKLKNEVWLWALYEDNGVPEEEQEYSDYIAMLKGLILYLKKSEFEELGGYIQIREGETLDEWILRESLFSLGADLLYSEAKENLDSSNQFSDKIRKENPELYCKIEQSHQNKEIVKQIPFSEN